MQAFKEEFANVNADVPKEELSIKAVKYYGIKDIGWRSTNSVHPEHRLVMGTKLPALPSGECKLNRLKEKGCGGRNHPPSSDIPLI